MAKKIIPDEQYKVRVTYKNPIDRKTGVMWMTGRQIYHSRRTRDTFSPYKNIVVLKEEKFPRGKK